MKQAMIFAAGLGTRLKPLTDTMPKALVTVAGQPLLYHVLARLRGAGFGRIVVNVHHFADQIIDYLHANENFGLDIRISDERGQLLDTGGGIKKAAPLFDAGSPILIHNVDILSNLDLERFFSAFSSGREKKGDAFLLVSERKTKRYLLFDEENRLVGWTNIETGETKSPHEWLKEGWSSSSRIPLLKMLAFSGIHILMPAVMPLLNEWPSRFSIMDFYLRHCRETKIMGVTEPGLRLIDVGKPETLAQAAQFIQEY